MKVTCCLFHRRRSYQITIKTKSYNVVNALADAVEKLELPENAVLIETRIR